MSPRRETLALVAIAASAAALALLTGYATTASPLAGFPGLGSGSATSEPVELQVLKDLVISPAAGAQGKLEETSWLKIVRHDDVNTTKLKLKLENIKQLASYFRYLIIQIREVAEYVASGTNVTTRSSTYVQDFSSWAVYRYLGPNVKVKHIADAINDSIVSQGLDKLGYTATSLAWEILDNVNKIYLVVRNDTQGPYYGREYVYKNISDTLLYWWSHGNLTVALAEALDRVHYRIAIYPDSQFSEKVFDSYEDLSWAVALDNDGDISNGFDTASNYTVTLVFLSSNDEQLFNITWTVRIYPSIPRIEITEMISVDYRILVLGNTRATLGFDKASGWWQPEDTLMVDEDSWKVDNGRAAMYGVTVFYEAEEGMLFDSLPIIINAEVLETG